MFFLLKSELADIWRIQKATRSTDFCVLKKVKVDAFQT